MGIDGLEGNRRDKSMIYSMPFSEGRCLMIAWTSRYSHGIVPDKSMLHPLVFCIML